MQDSNPHTLLMIDAFQVRCRYPVSFGLIFQFIVPLEEFESPFDILEGCCISIYAIGAFLYPWWESNPHPLG